MIILAKEIHLVYYNLSQSPSCYYLIIFKFTIYKFTSLLLNRMHLVMTINPMWGLLAEDPMYKQTITCQTSSMAI